MGLILNDKIKMMITGYPTVSDKYNVAGATLTGDTPVKFGDLVKLSDTKGYFEAIKTGDITEDKFLKIGGFVLGTNVKLNETWPEGQVQVNPGEAFNLLVSGFMAVELAEHALEEDIVANGEVYVTADGKITTLNDSNAVEDSEGNDIALYGVVFTGTYENQGTAENPKLIAEIFVK